MYRLLKRLKVGRGPAMLMDPVGGRPDGMACAVRFPSPSRWKTDGRDGMHSSGGVTTMENYIRDEHDLEDPDSASIFLSLVVGFGAGMVVSVPAVVATAMSFMAAGVGHGRSVVAKMLCPYIFLSTKYGVSESSEIYAASLFQYPIYGMIICLFGRLSQTPEQRRNGAVAAAVVAAIHLAAWSSAIFA